MRIWYPIPVWYLDDKRLLGEHNEILIVAKTIAGCYKVGWKNHPEVKRWIGYTKALAKRHDQLAEEMLRRGKNHKSPWPKELINPEDRPVWPTQTWEPLSLMIYKLSEKQGKSINWPIRI